MNAAAAAKKKNVLPGTMDTAAWSEYSSINKEAPLSNSTWFFKIHH